MTKGEKEFRLRPRKPPKRKRSDTGAWAVLFKTVMHYARASRSSRAGSSSGSAGRATRPYSQRCAVRAIYSRNTVTGQWRAHGRYLARDSATGASTSKGLGFDVESDAVDVAPLLDEWQLAGDERLWKLIVSPEFGERVDLKILARQLVERMEQDLKTPLQWVAVAHYDTEHPHVHIALRGMNEGRKPIRLERDYLKHSIREIASDLCTNQLGYRTEFDADAARRREVHEHRFTSLDRFIKDRAVQDKGPDRAYFDVALDRNNSRRVTTADGQNNHLARRLMALEGMGLARTVAPNIWQVAKDFDNILRSMQHIHDRQKTLAAQGAPVSDGRLPVHVLQIRDLTLVHGRVLVHGEEENGRAYLMLEGTEARIHHIYYTPEMEELRRRGGMRTNSFIRLQKVMVRGRSLLEIDDLGNSEAILRNRKHLHEMASQLLRNGLAPGNGWGGWLGRYQSAVNKAFVELAEKQQPKSKERTRSRER
jgi:hypothetical protein